MATEFVIYRSGAEYRWRLQTETQGIAAVGEGYETREDAIDGAEAVKDAVAAAPVVDRTGDD